MSDGNGLVSYVAKRSGLCSGINKIGANSDPCGIDVFIALL